MSGALEINDGGGREGSLVAESATFFFCQNFNSPPLPGKMAGIYFPVSLAVRHGHMTDL